ncbi:MAG: adenosylmethionine decarboxylase [Myxococcales bacterium]|nr:adenosylmethionine decarboxylase [Myxococcales bacterium]
MRSSRSLLGRSIRRLDLRSRSVGSRRQGLSDGGGTVPTIGSHWILEMYDCPAEVIDDVGLVSAAIRGAAKAARSTLLHESAHSFEPQGVTALGLLAESHISVHTWPELGYAACDVLVVDPAADPEAACAHLASALESRHHHLQRIDRGRVPAPPRPTEPSRSARPRTSPPSDPVPVR